MSNIYNLEPPTKGKVLIHTTYGDIDVELWARETPIACRNFVQLCLEGYYDDTIVHRVIRDFMVQMGDPTGTGEGGESIFGSPFRDEIHQRLRFTHRGIVAMANENKPHTNGSQFFITLGACEHLKGKHTIFGKVTGNTIFNVTRIGEADTGPDDRPISPIKVTSVEVLSNPFDDIVPRDLSGVKRQKKVDSEEDAEEKRREAKRQARLERAAKKDLKLLSFGDEEEEEEEEGATKVRRVGGLKSMHDVIKDDPTLRAEADEDLVKAVNGGSGKGGGGDGEEERRKVKTMEKIKQKAAAASGGAGGKTRGGGVEDDDDDDDDGGAAGGFKLGGADAEAEAFAARMRSQIQQRKRKLVDTTTKQGGGSKRKGGDEEEGDGGEEVFEDLEERQKQMEMKKKIQEKTEEYKKLKSELKNVTKAAVVEMGEKAKKRQAEKGFREMVSPLEQRRQKFLEMKRHGKGNREEDTLAKLKSFRENLSSKKKEAIKADVKKPETEAYHGQVLEESDILDGDDDAGDDWMVGGLKFKKHIDDQYRGGDGRRADDYVVIRGDDDGGGGKMGAGKRKEGGSHHHKSKPHHGSHRDRR